MKIVNSFEDSNLLIKGITKEQGGIFLGKLLRWLICYFG